MPLAYGTFRGRVQQAIRPAGSPPVGAVGHIFLTPRVPYVTSAADDTTVQCRSYDIHLKPEDNGFFEVQVLASTNPGFNPTDFTYQLDTTGLFDYDGFVADVEIGPGEVVDLSDLLPAVISGGVVTLRGPAGPPGEPGHSDVTGQDLQLAFDTLNARMDALQTGTGTVLPQSTPAATWVFPNPTGRLCLVTVFVGGAVWLTDVVVTPAAITVTLAAPASGYVVIA